MKKILIGLVIALMMTGSGYAGIYMNGEQVEYKIDSKLFNKLEKSCFSAIEDGKFIFSENNIQTYYYDKMIIRIGNMDVFRGLNCNIKTTFRN